MASRYRTIRQRTRLLVEEALNAVRTGFSDDTAGTRSPELAQLEQRLLMSASPVAVAVEAAPELAGAESVAVVESNADTAIESEDSAAGQESVQQVGIELVVIDPSADNHEVLVSDLQQQTDRRFEILVLDPHRDGIEQITEALQELSDVSALHLVSHGDEGEVLLGTSVLSQRTIDRYAAELLSWQDSLSPDADLLIYGCDLAGTEEGIELTESLNVLLGADVAASNDDTGHADLGGDWVFEQLVGNVQTDVAFSLDVQADWHAVLAVQNLATTSEGLVNQTVDGVQTTNSSVRGSEQAVAIAPNGEYVVVWTSGQNTGDDGDGTGVLMRRFNALGVPVSNEVQVNTVTGGDQQNASVALDSNGRGVVVWRDGDDIMARLFDESNGFASPEFRVQSTTSGARRSPEVDIQANGNFIVAWSGEGNSGNDEIYYRRFNADGTAIDASEVRANSNDVGNEEDPAVAINDSGQFVVTWEVSGRLYIRHFNTDGTPSHGDGRVENDLSATSSPDVDINNSGESILVYRESGAFGIGAGVWGRGYNFDGSVRENYFAVSSGSSDNTDPSVSMADDGSFVVVYHGTGDGDGNGHSIKLRKYDATANPIAASEIVNETTVGDQTFASVAVLDTDNFVVVWSGNGDQSGDTDGSGVFFRQYGQLTPDSTLTASADTYLSKDTPTANFGGSSVVAIDKSGGGSGDGRGLIRFDVSSIPPATTIGRAVLRLEAVGGTGDFDISAFRATESWVESEATWQERQSGTAWGASGGSFDSTALDTQAATVSGVHEWDITSLVQDWVGGTHANHGVILASTDFGASVINFESSEGGAGPQLLIYDSPPVAAAAGLPGNAPPVATAGTNIVIAAGDDLILAGTGSDPDTDPLTYAWDLNYDGVTFAADVTGQNPTIAYSALLAEGLGPGVFDVALQVDDGKGGVDVDVLELTITTTTLTVDTTADVADGNTSSIAALYADKGADGKISLREAIIAANNTANGANPDRIEFDIPDALVGGAHTITIQSELPDVTDTVVIDATTDADFVASPVIVLDGASAGASSNGLTLGLGADGSTVRGLAITQFEHSGIVLTDSSGHIIAGNYLGTDHTGTADEGNKRHGISLIQSNGNTIGGTTVADRNVIVANDLDGINLQNSDNNVIRGNYIGFLADGSAALGNSDDGIDFGGDSNGNQIGGAASGEGNVIAGHGNNGLEFGGTANANTVQGNWIGVSPAGVSFGNNTAGVRLHTNAADNTIGGTGAGEGNEIAFNGAQGVSTSGGATRNLIIGNAIHSNGGLGVDVGHDGAVTLETSTPVLIRVDNAGPNLLVRGTVTGTPGEVYTIAVYASATQDASGHGEAERFLTSFDVTIPGSGSSTVQFNEVIAGSALSTGDFVTATSSDSAGTTSEFAANFRVGDNDPPVADIAVTASIEEGQSITVDGTGSSDPDGDSLTYEWDLDYDGATFSADFSAASRTLTWAELVAFGIDDDGSYQVALRVNDGTDDSAVVTSALTVTNTAPTYTVTGSSEAVAGEAYSLTLNTSDPGSDSVTAWTVNWGDGEVVTYAATQTTVSHVYTNPGFTSNISVSVRDEDGSYSNSQIVATSNVNSRLYFNDGTTESVRTAPGNPAALTVGPDGYLYVGNFATDDIDRFDPVTGDFVDRFVIERSGGLNAPASIAFGPDGTLYVSSYGSDEVLRFGNDGRVLGAFITGINNPDGLAFDRDGNLYLSEQSTGNIYKYDGRTGVQIGSGPFASFGHATFVKLHVQPSGHLFASSTVDNVIREFDTNGNAVGDFGGGPLTDLTSASGFTWGPAGRLYVADNQGDQIGVYSSSGTFLESIGTGIDGPVTVVATAEHQVHVTAAPEAENDSYSVVEGNSFSVPVPSGWYNASWKFRQELLFDNAGHAQQVNEARVLVRLHETAADAVNIDYANTRDAGEDIRFVDQDGTLLDHQVEAWDEGGYSYVWVEVPQIDALSGSDAIFVYYGNENADDGSASGEVWGANYSGVYHLNATSVDASSSGNSGAISSVVAANGIVGGAGAFDGSESRIRIPTSPDIDDLFVGGGTVSAWINPESVGENGFGRILDKANTTFGGGATGNGWTLQIASNEKLIFESGFSGSAGRWRTADGTITLNTWQHVAVTYDNSSAANDPQIFIDGVEVAVTRTRTPTGVAQSDSGIDAAIGNYSGGTTRTFDGRIDEVRISVSSRTARNIAVEYESVLGSFVSSAGVETFSNGVLTNDSDSDGHPLSVTLVSGPAHSSAFTLNPDGSFSYTHDGSETTSDSFQYSVSDGTTTTGPVTVNLTVLGANDPPSVTAIGTQTITEDTASGPIAFTVSDPDNAAGALVVTATSSNQSLIADGGILISGSGANRSLVLNPVANAVGGPVVITLTVSDGAASATTTFQVNIDPGNDPPQISAISDVVTTEDTAFSGINFTVSDVDNAAGDLIVTATSADQTLIRDADIVVSGAGANRSLQLRPVTDQTGSTAITVSVTDGASTTTTTFNVSVTASNDEPVLAPISDVVIAEDTDSSPITLSVSDVDNAASDLVVTAVSSNQTLIRDADLSISGSGSSRTLIVRGAPNQTGGPVTVTVTVSDGSLSNQQTFEVTITGSNDPPQISAISDVVTTEDTAFSGINFTVSDVDNAAGDLIVTATSADQTLIRDADIVVSGTGTNRQLSIAPAPNATGNGLVTVTVSDGTTSSTETFQVGVTAVDDTPQIATIADQAMTEDVAMDVAITISDADTSAADLIVTASSSDPALIRSTDLVVLGNGVNRTLRITPVANATGGPVTVTLEVSDGVTASQRTFTVTLSPANDSPLIGALPDVNVLEDSTIAPIAFAIGDPDDPVSALTLSVSSSDHSVVADSELSLSGTGYNRVLRINPAAHANGTTTISIAVSDGKSTTVESFKLAIDAVNDRPVIESIADIVSAEDELQTVSFRVRDVDAVNSGLVVTAVSSDQALIANGDISIVTTGGGNRILTYRPRGNAFGGPVEISVTVSDGVLTASTTFEATITPVNDVPVFSAGTNFVYRVDDSLTFESKTGALMEGVTDVEGDAMTVRLVKGPEHGLLTLEDNGTFTFVADTDFDGVDSFQFVVNDGTGDSEVKRVRLRIPTFAVIPSAPVALPVTTAEESDSEPPSETESEVDTFSDDESIGTDEVLLESSDDPIAGVTSEDAPPDGSRSQDDDDEELGHVAYSDDLAPELLIGLQQAKVTSATGGGFDAGSGGVDLADLERVFGTRLSILQLQQVDNGLRGSDGAELSTLFTTTPYETFYEIEGMVEQLDRFRDEIDTQIDLTSVAANVLPATGATVIVGSVVTAIRTGVLALGFLTQLPVWTMFDPLMVMDGVGTEEGDSLEEIVDRNARKASDRARKRSDA